MATKRKTPKPRKSGSATRVARAPKAVGAGVASSMLQVAGAPRPTIVVKKGPGALTLAKKTALLKGLGFSAPGAVYATLSPSRPEAGSYAALVFTRPHMVEGGSGYATWILLDGGDSSAEEKKKTQEEGVGQKLLGIWFKSEGANRRYLIDCAVNGGLASNFGVSSDAVQEFTLRHAPTLAHIQDSFLRRAGDNMTWVAETQDDGWCGFCLMSQSSWTFWSCEITRL